MRAHACMHARTHANTLKTDFAFFDSNHDHKRYVHNLDIRISLKMCKASLLSNQRFYALAPRTVLMYGDGVTQLWSRWAKTGWPISGRYSNFVKNKGVNRGELEEEFFFFLILGFAVLAYLNVKKKKKLYKANSELKITAESMPETKRNTAYPFDLVICKFNQKLSRLAFGLSGT